MERSVTEYLAALREADWQSPEVFTFPTPLSRAWLTEQGSLSARLERHCRELSLELLQNELTSLEQLLPSEQEYLPSEDYWLRKVILKGDGQPWVLGRTLIPQSSQSSGSYDLANQGSTPLGFTVFRHDTVRRDKLQLAQVDLADQRLFARRSRLWVADKPILVAELFLPSAPIYAQGSRYDTGEI
ncbi:chorismate lyase [Vibrio sp. WXL103]|uniref:chorismate lyase n=1 Tax=unclassified Vibrio TaxID=2614977 RepID=UPI003EC933BB